MQQVKAAKEAKKAARRELNYAKPNGISQEQNQTLASSVNPIPQQTFKKAPRLGKSYRIKHLAVLETPVRWRVNK